MKLFLIVYENDDGENLDLLVWAHLSSIAVDIWRQHYELEDEAPRDVFEVPTQEPAEPGAICWSQIPSCPA